MKSLKRKLNFEKVRTSKRGTENEEAIDILKLIAVKLISIEEELINVREEVSSLKGDGLYNSIADVSDKLDDVKSDLFTISLK